MDGSGRPNRQTGKDTNTPTLSLVETDTMLAEVHTLLDERKGKSGVPFRDRVPRHLISSFSGDASVTTTVRTAEIEKKDIIDSLKQQNQFILDPESIPSEIAIERHQRFKDGDFLESYFTLRCDVRVKTGHQKKWVPYRHRTNPGRTIFASHLCTRS